MKRHEMMTVNGHLFTPTTGAISEVNFADIASALSKLCRFGGHVEQFYSVAEHSVLVSRIIADWRPDHVEAQWAGLLHDATEAYVVDIPTPIKRLLADYAPMEARFAETIASALSIDWTPEVKELVAHADAAALRMEAEALIPRSNLEHPRWDFLFEIPELYSEDYFVHSLGLLPAQARDLFTKELATLAARRSDDRRQNRS